MKVKFAHISDCHLGAWRNESLNTLGNQAFEMAINIIIREKVDFVIISGDLFDVSNPKVDIIDLTVRELRKLKDNNIPVYGIMGSHDFSPSDKSMIRPLITAGLFINISKGESTEDNKLKLLFTQDPKTQIKLTGLRARKRSLEIEDYKKLDLESLEKETGIKIFVLHTMLNELKPIEFKDMESAPKSLLPKNFHYYAGGHLHKTLPKELRENDNFIGLSSKNNIIYPGALSLTDFREVETYKYGGMCIISGDIDHSKKVAHFEVKFVPLKIIDVITIDLNCDNKSALQVQNILKEKTTNLNVKDKIITLRLHGNLSSGKTYEIKTNEFIQSLKEKGAYEVLVNKFSLSSKEYSAVKVPSGKSNEEIESVLIYEHVQKLNIKNISKKSLENKVHELLGIIGKEREEGMKVKDYNELLIANFTKIFQLVEDKE
ncbi:MAG: exonuclease SbcCD subunit D [Candidatus Hermodarchaeota archaeon]